MSGRGGSKSCTGRGRREYDHPMIAQDSFDFVERASRRCRRFIVLQFPIARASLMNAGRLCELFLGKAREDTSRSQLPSGDDVRHRSAPVYLPSEGKSCVDRGFE
jgi:hypothetical protein